VEHIIVSSAAPDQLSSVVAESARMDVFDHDLIHEVSEALSNYLGIIVAQRQDEPVQAAD